MNSADLNVNPIYTPQSIMDGHSKIIASADLVIFNKGNGEYIVLKNRYWEGTRHINQKELMDLLNKYYLSQEEATEHDAGVENAFSLMEI